MTQALPIPATDSGPETFVTMTDAERDWLAMNLAIFGEIDRAPKVTEACRRAGRQCEHLGRGWDWRSIYRRYKSWLTSGRDPLSIRRRYRSPVKSLPDETIAWWRSEWARSRGRKDCLKATYHRLTRHWLRGGEVPGLGTIYTWWAEKHPTLRFVPSQIPRPRYMPQGWSYDTFVRHVKPRSHAGQHLIAFGHFAAHSHWSAQVMRDTSALRPLEYILFDDVRFDKKVLAQAPDGSWQSVYPVGIVGYCLATRCDLEIALMPRLQREDGSHHGITRDGLRLCLHTILSTYGLPPYPMTLVVEKAAAALSAADQNYITNTFGDRIRIIETSMEEYAELRGGMKERHGTPWSKAWIESYFRPLQTALAHLPGATGNRYDNNPGTLEASERAALDLVAKATARGIPVSSLRTPLKTFDQFHAAVREAMEMLRWRTDHQIRSFDEVFEAELPDGSYIPIEDPDALPANATIQRPRKEAPVERMQRIIRQQSIRFEAIHPGMIYPLLHEKARVKIVQGRINVSAQRLRRKAGSGTPVVYWQRDHDLLNNPDMWSQDLDGYFPEDMSCVHLVRDGAYLGTVRRLAEPGMDDTAALRATAADVVHARNTEAALLRETYLEPQQREWDAAQEHNRTVLAAHPETGGQAMARAEQAVSAERRERKNIRDAITRATRDEDFSVDQFADITSEPIHKHDVPAADPDFEISELRDEDVY